MRSSGLASYLVAADDFRVLGFGRTASEAVHLRREDVPASGGALPVAGADVAPAPATAPPAPGPAEGASTATLRIAAAAAPAAAAAVAAALTVSAVLLSTPIAHVRKSKVGVCCRDEASVL